MVRAPKRTKSIAFADWHPSLRKEWEDAFSDPNIIDEAGGIVLLLTEAHKRNVLHAVEIFIKYQTDWGVPLDRSLEDRLADTVAISTFYEIRREEEEEFSRSQRGKLTTALHNVERLQSARLRILKGRRDWLFDEYMRDLRNGCSGRGQVLSAPVDIPHLRRIATGALDVLKAAIEANTAVEGHYRDYQTALGLGFLVQVPVRVRSFCGMKASAQRLRNGCFTFQIPILKNRKWEALQYRMAEDMTPFFSFFLNTVRPFFNVGSRDDLWLYDDGSPLPAHIHAYRFTSLIRAGAGVHMSPHRVRHAAAAHAQSLGMNSAEIASVLQERNSTTVERHYKPASTVVASEAYDLFNMLTRHRKRK